MSLTTHLIFHVRRARRKAVEAARTEAMCLLGDLNPTLPSGGPLSELGGVFWLDLPRQHLDVATDRFPLLGYSASVDLLMQRSGRWSDHSTAIRWRKNTYEINRLYEEDPVKLRELDPDCRPFIFETRGGTRLIRGYRGDGSQFGRRALPACDARLLVNLVSRTSSSLVLDPFAGAGGIVGAAIATGTRAVSLDLDPRLRFGLRGMGAFHAVSDAFRLPLRQSCVPAIATELPFDRSLEGRLQLIVDGLHECLCQGGRMALMCAAQQRQELRLSSRRAEMRVLLDTEIDRKRTACAIMAWERE